MRLTLEATPVTTIVYHNTKYMMIRNKTMGIPRSVTIHLLCNNFTLRNTPAVLGGGGSFKLLKDTHKVFITGKTAAACNNAK